MSLGDLKVALVHDELTRRGGAEIVFEELAAMFERADLYALYAGEPRLLSGGTARSVHTSFLQRLPVWFRRHPSRLLPLLPQAAEQFDLSSYDVVISSASAFAKSLVTRVNVPHICYCHAPTRYLWNSGNEAPGRVPRLLRAPGKAALHYLRLVDFAAAQRVDLFAANSEFTRQGIATYYRRPSDVVYPPIDTAFYTPQPRGSHKKDYFLAVGRLTDAKNFDQAVRVSEKMRLPLIVVGTGAAKQRLRSLAGNQVRFVGRVSDEELRSYYRGARAFLQPGEEDFGMAAAEALACGTPVIAYGGGGSAEVVQHGRTGILYDDPREEALAEALRQFLMTPRSFPSEMLQQSVLKFSRQRFREGIEKIVQKALETRAAQQ
jgi:glycosyltransferase involved in cell wall biosynthesis